MRQWRCNHCGEWVSIVWLKHHHWRGTPLTFDEMREARKRGDNSFERVDYISETWTPQHEMRDAPPANAD